MLKILPVCGDPDAELRMAPIVAALRKSEVFLVADALEPQPDAVLVHGGSSSALDAALSAAQRGIPVVHLDAGRRDGRLAGPPAGEPARRTIGRIAALHLAPTEHAKRILLASGVPEERIVVTGDTVVDALTSTLGGSVAATERSSVIVLIAAHRPELLGVPVQNLGSAVRLLAARFPHHEFVLSVSPGVAVHAGLASTLGRPANILTLPLLPFTEMVNLVSRAAVVVTDLAEVEDIAPTFNTPALVLGTTTERPEGMLAGSSRVIGTHVETIVDEVAILLTDPVRHAAMAGVLSPFGDGRASERSVAAVAALLGAGDRLPDFASAALAVGSR